MKLSSGYLYILSKERLSLDNILLCLTAGDLHPHYNDLNIEHASNRARGETNML